MLCLVFESVFTNRQYDLIRRKLSAIDLIGSRGSISILRSHGYSRLCTRDVWKFGITRLRQKSDLLQ